MVSVPVRGEPKTENRPVLAILPWLLLALTVVLGAAAVVLLLVNQNGPGGEPIPGLYSDLVYLFSAVVGATVGALIVARRRRNPIGWLLIAVPLSQVAEDVSVGYSAYGLITRPGALPASVFAAWLAQWLWTPVFAALLFAILLYPTGHLLSRRWRVVAWAGLAGNVVLLLAGALASEIEVGNGNPPLTLPNPIGVLDGKNLVQPILFPGALAFILAVLFVALASLVIRFRRARGDERQQIKWFTYAVALALVAESLAGAVLGDWAGVVQNLAFMMIPLSIGVAILKYRLYDIDLVINRTLVYVPLTAILAGIFAASITLSQKLFIAITGTASDAATVLTTLVVVAAFDPLKLGLQHIVDRRFKEGRDPTKQLKVYKEQVRSFVQMMDAKQNARRLLDETARAFDAKGGRVYLQRDGQLELVHTVGEWNGESAISIPLESESTRLGLLALGARRSGAEYMPDDRQTLRQIVEVTAEAIALSERADGVRG